MVLLFCGSQGRAEITGSEAPIVNGVLSSESPAVGMLLYSPFGDPNSASMICTGTLVGCHTFLTAAHCVCDSLGVGCQGPNAPNPSHFFVFLQNAGVFAVQSIAVPVQFDFPVADVAVVRLTSDVTGIRPALINNVQAPPPGTPGRIVGFGRTGGRDQAVGIKRAGNVVTVTCTQGISNTSSVCWNFLPPLGAPGTNSNTCNGDSGGPLFIDFGSGPLLAGVTSGGNLEGCSLGDFSYDANVYEYRSWIQSQAGGDLGATNCGLLAQVGSPGARVADYAGALSRNELLVYDFEVPPGMQEVRVTVNAQQDFDLFVRKAPGVSETNFDCKDDGVRAIGTCSFTNPQPGQWSALIRAYQSSGPYQLAITQLGWRCDIPANSGKPCNDGNDCTANDTCQGSQCTGIPVSDGTSCSDGNPCTNPDQCQGGFCVGGEEPQTACKRPTVVGASRLVLRDPVTGDPVLRWQWQRGEATSLAELGNPRAATDVTLCLYDYSAGSASLVWQQTLSPGGFCTTKKTCWIRTKNGYRFRSLDGAQGGVTSLRWNSGLSGKANISLRATTSNFTPPALPLDQDPTVVFQLSNGQACWEGRFSTSVRNSDQSFEARSD